MHGHVFDHLQLGRCTVYRTCGLPEQWVRASEDQRDCGFVAFLYHIKEGYKLTGGAEPFQMGVKEAKVSDIHA